MNCPVVERTMATGYPDDREAEIVTGHARVTVTLDIDINECHDCRNEALVGAVAEDELGEVLWAAKECLRKYTAFQFPRMARNADSILSTAVIAHVAFERD